MNIRKELTFFCLSIGDLQIKIVAFADLFLLEYLLLEFADGDVQAVEGYFITIYAAFESVVDRHFEDDNLNGRRERKRLVNKPSKNKKLFWIAASRLRII